jgi:hypothetical protein
MTTQEQSSSKSRKLRDEFKDLPVSDKVATLVEFEIMTIADGFEKLGECSISLGKKILETAFPNTCHESEKSEARPSSE